MSGDHAICPACGGENLAGAKFCGACGQDLSTPAGAAPAPATPAPVAPEETGPKRTMLGMMAVPPPGAPGSPSAEPPPAAPASTPPPATPSGGAHRNRTMLGMSPIAPPGQELPSLAQPPADDAAPTTSAAPVEPEPPTSPAPTSPVHLPATTNRTMLGMPQAEIEKAAAAARAAMEEAEEKKGKADPLGPSNRTMLGMTARPMPGSGRDSQRPGPPAATPPAGAPRRRAQVKFADADQVPSVPPGKGGSRIVVVLGVLGVFFLLVMGAGLGLYLVFGGDDVTVRASVVPTEAGDGLRVEVGGDDGTTHVRFAGQEVSLSGGVATFPLAADTLHLGDNELTVELVGDDGEVTAHEVTLTVSYRIRADVTTLTADPPVLTIVVDALPGSEVTIGGEPVALDDAGRGQRAFPIEGEMGDTALEHRAEYRVSLADGQEHAGAVDTRVPYATLQIDRPGANVVTDSETVEIAGAVNQHGTLSVDGEEVTTTDEGRFVHPYPLPNVGEHEARLVARQPGRAPRVASLSIRRVEDLRAEAASFRPEPGLSYARIAQNPTIYRDQRIALEGRVYNINVANGRSVLQMLVRECPRGERCPLWVTYPQATDATINDWVRVLGTVAGEQQFRSESDRVITVPRVDAQFILPAQAR